MKGRFHQIYADIQIYKSFQYKKKSELKFPQSKNNLKQSSNFSYFRKSFINHHLSFIKNELRFRRKSNQILRHQNAF